MANLASLNQLATARLWPALVLAAAPFCAALLLWHGLSPRTLDVGYCPRQPVEFSHALHAGELHVDCRYCHTTVERAACAALPPVETCWHCHATIRTDSAKLALVRERLVAGLPVEWTRVHRLPDDVFFDHSIHAHGGVGCVECHGRVDQMERVRQAEPLNMGWCLDCHRNPAAHLRPRALHAAMEASWPPDGQDAVAAGRDLVQQYRLRPPTDCVACHR